MNNIIELNTNDIPELILLEKEYFKRPWSENNLQSEIENPSSFAYCIKYHSRIVAYYILNTCYDIAEIFKIAVVSDYRGKGYSKLLMDKIISQSKSVKCKKILLEVSSVNSTAIKLYKKYNFIAIATRKNYYKDSDALIMEKIL